MFPLERRLKPALSSWYYSRLWEVVRSLRWETRARLFGMPERGLFGHAKRWEEKLVRVKRSGRLGREDWREGKPKRQMKSAWRWELIPGVGVTAPRSVENLRPACWIRSCSHAQTLEVSVSAHLLRVCGILPCQSRSRRQAHRATRRLKRREACHGREPCCLWNVT